MAQKPKAPEWLIENIAEASKNARKIYFLYMGLLAYCALTIVSTSDRQIILNETATLPILKLDVPLNGFFVLAPVIAIFIFAYFQLYLNMRKKLINRLKKDYPSAEGERLYPWMLIALDFPGHAFIERLRSAIIKFSVWYSLPLVLALISTWFVKKHEPKLSYIIGLAPMVGTIVVLWFWCQYEDVKFRVLQIPRFLLENWGKNILLFVVIAYEVIFLSFLIPMANEGFPQITQDAKGYQKYLKSWFCVNLSHEKLVTEPETDYEGLYWANLKEAHLEGANLINVVLKRADLKKAHLNNAMLLKAILVEADLEGANLQEAWLGGANLQKADLRGANLQGAYLRKADLQEALLIGANLQEAWLVEANLQKANLSRAELRKANLREANLQGANIRDANPQEANLFKANLQGADLGLANLQGADLSWVNLQKADLRVANLQGANLWKANLQEAWGTEANLQGAYLREANLQEAYLRDANLQEARLRKAENLTIEQLSKVKTLYRAKLDPELMDQIKQKYPHLLEKPKEK